MMKKLMIVLLSLLAVIVLLPLDMADAKGGRGRGKGAALRGARGGMGGRSKSRQQEIRNLNRNDSLLEEARKG
jgi:hypothetical protein